MRKTGRPLSFDRSMALDRAMETFWRYGYDGASINILTTEMGITAPSLYTAFGDKQRLYLEALDRYMHRPGLDLTDLLENSPTAYDAIKQMLVGGTKQQTRPGRPRGCMLMSASVNTPAESSLEKAVIQRRKAMQKMIERRISRGIEDGDVPSETSVTDVANFYVMVLQGMSVQARDGAGQKDLLAVVNRSLMCWPRE
jgi:AcrR family transcriptional regulator